MSGYAAAILADSVSEAGIRLTTMVVTLPRLVLAELNTHRVFSRNSASSRAIPVDKQLERIRNHPFIPWYWGRNQAGMQAETELTGWEREHAADLWIEARDSALASASALHQLGVHKQLSNRLLEPFMWQTVIITATEWDNFFALRANPDAQPEIRRIAEMMLNLYEGSSPTVLGEGEWHLPLIQDDERDGEFEYSEAARKVSAARCARVSYLTHDGRRDVQADLKLYERLVSGGHMSPLEHVATPFTESEWLAHDRMADAAADARDEIGLSHFAAWQLIEAAQFNGNFRGWTQLRKLIPNEHNFSLI